MATRLQDAKIRVTLETEDARQRLDEIIGREKELEGARREDDRTREDRERASRGEDRDTRAGESATSPTIRGTVAAARRGIGTFLGAAEFATQVVTPLISGGLGNLIEKIPFFGGEEAAREVSQNVQDAIANAVAPLTEKLKEVEALKPAAEEAAQVLRATVVAGGTFTQQEARSLFDGLSEIRAKKAEVEAAQKRLQIQTLSQALPDVALRMFGVSAAQ